MTLHGGEPVRVTAHPGEEGIWFRYGAERIEALPENVTDTTRCTRLGGISTIEHLMSALAGCEVTDAEIELTNNELPALDGCSEAYTLGILNAGFSTLGYCELPNLFERIFSKNEQSEIAIAKGNGRIHYQFETGNRWPYEQEMELDFTPPQYLSEIAPARTFGFEEEVEMIQKAGLAKGLNESNVFLLGQSGYLQQTRFPDEPVRHKILDLIGDIYLAGMPIRYLSLHAIKSGHTQNDSASSWCVKDRVE
jgi:UDP-3-O-acyl-N-acetylglucosamine deacetylase